MSWSCMIHSSSLAVVLSTITLPYLWTFHDGLRIIVSQKENSCFYLYFYYNCIFKASITSITHQTPQSLMWHLFILNTTLNFPFVSFPHVASWPLLLSLFLSPRIFHIPRWIKSLQINIIHSCWCSLCMIMWTCTTVHRINPHLHCEIWPTNN